jgi:hypothetical protein
MIWQISKSAEINEETCIANALVLTHTGGDSLNFCMNLYASDADSAPDYEEDPDVDLVGVLKYDFSEIALNKFENKRRKGQRIYQLDHTVRVFMGSKEGVLNFKVTTGDQLIGEIEIDFSKG